MTRVVVTGGAGFVGTNLCAALARERVEVVSIDPVPPPVEIPGVQSVRARVQDLDDPSLADLLRGARHIFHLAAEARIQPSTELANLPGYVSENILSLAVLLRSAARVEGLGKVVFAGSSSIYDNTESAQPEDHPVALKSPYAFSKHAGEWLCEYFSESLPVVIVRFFNAYGPWEPFFGHDSPYSTVVARFINAKLTGRHATLFGGDQLVDFTYVDDVVAGLVRAANTEAISHPGAPAAFNLGTGRSASIRELAQLIGADVEEAPPRKFDVSIKRADVSHAATQLDWRAEVSLEEGIRRSIAWWQAHGGEQRR